MGRIVFILIVSSIFIALDLYVYHGMASIFAQGKWGKFYKTVFLGLSAFSYFSIIYVYWQFSSGNSGYRTELFNFLSGYIFTILVTKLLFSGILFLQDGGLYLFLKEDISLLHLPQSRQEFLFLGCYMALQRENINTLSKKSHWHLMIYRLLLMDLK